MSQPLLPNTVYRLDLTNQVQLGPISKQTLYERFTDGRVFGLLSEDLANALYNNLTKSPSARSAFDLMDDQGRRYECRTVSKGGANLLPSAQIGVGRSPDLNKHRAKMKTLYAVVFVDIRDSPIFRIVAIPTKNLGTITKISPSQFENMIQNMPRRNL